MDSFTCSLIIPDNLQPQRALRWDSKSKTFREFWLSNSSISESQVWESKERWSSTRELFSFMWRESLVSNQSIIFMVLTLTSAIPQSQNHFHFDPARRNHQIPGVCPHASFLVKSFASSAYPCAMKGRFGNSHRR
jgi:hypothetical protein